MNLRTAATLSAYIATIPAANILVTQFHTWPVDGGLFGWGLYAPAGVFTVGLALVLRDIAHEMTSRTVILAAIGVGTLISLLLGAPAFADWVQGTVWANLATSTRIASASAVSFLLAELVDFVVYARLRRKGLIPALLASNVVGLVIDSLLFLYLAFGSLQFLTGQIVAKAEMTVLAALVLGVWVSFRARRLPQPVGDRCACTRMRRALQAAWCGHCPHDRCVDCGMCAGAGHGPHLCTATT